MVITVVWLQSWINLTLTIGTLIIVVFFIFFCTCFDQKKKKNTFYVVDANKENVKSPCNLHVFRRFSTSPDPETSFTSKNLPFFALKNQTSQVDLTDSLEVTKSFDTGVLRFDEYNFCKDELRSCISTESLNSFYSAHQSTIIRGTSKESFVSLISEFDNEI